MARNLIQNVLNHRRKKNTIQGYKTDFRSYGLEVHLVSF